MDIAVDIDKEVDSNANGDNEVDCDALFKST